MSIENRDILGFVTTFSLSTKVRCTKLPNLVDIDFIKSDDGYYLLGLNVKILKNNIDKALEDSKLIANKIASIISLKTMHYVTVTTIGYSGIPKPGKTAPVSRSMTFIYNIKGKEPILELENQDVTDVLKLDNSEYSFLQRLDRAILHHKAGFPAESLKELFTVIEYDKAFANHDKYYGLRQILSHAPNYSSKNPPYNKATINKFTSYFDKSDFDYLEYDPSNLIIILDMNSTKTRQTLEGIFSNLINEVKSYVRQKLGFTNPI